MYNWDLEEFKKKREYLISLRKSKRKKTSDEKLMIIDDAIATYDFLLGKYNSEDYSEVEEDLSDRIFTSKYFINMYRSINPNIITVVNNACNTFERNNFIDTDYSNETLEIKSVIDMCKDIFSSFNDPELMKKVNNILDEDNHLLDISNSSEIINFKTIYSGFSVKDNYNKIGYAKIYSNNKIRDLYTLVHEIFHLVIEDNNRITSYSDDNFYTEEVEGAFSDLIVTDYLYKNKIFMDDARSIEIMNFNNTKDFVRNIFISHNYHNYFKDDKFDLRRIKSDLKSKGLRFTGFSNLDMRDSMVSFNRDLCYSFSYLIALDLFFKYKNGYKNIISDIEGISMGKYPFIMLERYGITFYKDGYSNLDTYQKILKKEKR